MLAAMAAMAAPGTARADYVNFESSQVHPIALTPSGGRLLAVNTPDALLEVFVVGARGELTQLPPIPVGLEPVTVVARSDSEAWVVNHLSDTISVVDINQGTTIRTLPTGDEPTDVVFARGRAYVTASNEDAVRAFLLADLSLPPIEISVPGRNPRALAVSNDGGKVYAVVLNSGNQTTVVNANVIAANNPGLNLTRLSQLGLQ
jgi:YVTN family beta-propeller protein